MKIDDTLTDNYLEELKDQIKYTYEKFEYLQTKYEDLISEMRTQESRDQKVLQRNLKTADFHAVETYVPKGSHSLMPVTLWYYKDFTKKDQLIKTWKKLEDIKFKGTELINDVINMKHTSFETLTHLRKISDRMLKSYLTKQGFTIKKYSDLYRYAVSENIKMIPFPVGRIWSGALEDKRFGDEWNRLSQLYKKIIQLHDTLHDEDISY